MKVTYVFRLFYYKPKHGGRTIEVWAQMWRHLSSSLDLCGLDRTNIDITVDIEFGYQRDIFMYVTDAYDCGSRVNLKRPIKTSSIVGSAKSLLSSYPSETTTCSICPVSNVRSISASGSPASA